jgi:hypothetical protein
MIANWFANLDPVCWILVVTAIIAAVGCRIAHSQLRNLSKTSKANVLFNLEKKYDDIIEGRKTVHSLVTQIKKRAGTKNLGREEEDELISEITSQMERWENEDATEYSEIKKVLDFCEYIGYLMISKYLSLEEVKALYVPAILNWGRWFQSYIAHRQKWEGEDVYKYFMLAYQKLNGHQNRDVPTL